MKKMLAILLAAVFIFAAVPVAALDGLTWNGKPATLQEIGKNLDYDLADSDGDYKPLYLFAAEQLWKDGLFLGSGGLFNLDKPITRVEGIVMAIRLAGKEQEALAAREKSAFTDVPGWAEYYVGYAAKTGMTRGVSAQRFGSGDTMSAQQYLTFVLRVLGYQDNVDFTFDKAVEKSLELGLIGASHYGVKACECKDFKRSCPRRFSDPNATWGWDSHNAQYFYGYTGYFISCYNKNLKLDLPLYLRFVEAKRHDSVSAVVSLAEFRDMHSDLNINSFISDSASDNYPTYELLNHWNINAVIALNNRSNGNFSYPPALSLDNNGTPVCQAGHRMIYNGFCPDRCRFKWRCPCILGKVASSDICSTCSKSKYGRGIYTKPDWVLRLFSRIPRASQQFKSLFKQRTAAERINNRILNHYNLQNSHARGKKRISFFATLDAVNIHLDAWISQYDLLLASLFFSIFCF